MTIQQREIIKELRAFIKQFRKKETRLKEENRLHVNTPLSGFLSLILSKSSSVQSNTTYNHLVSFADKFEQKHKATIDLKDLIERNWIRIVFDIIQIPKVIRSAAYTAKKHKKSKTELEFLVELYETQGNNPFDVANLKSFLKEYKKTSGKKVNEHKITNEFHVKEANGKIKLTNFSLYKPLIEQWDVFLFISEWIQRSKYRKLVIKKSVLKSVYTNYIKIHPNSFNLEDLFEKQILKNEKSGYVSISVEDIDRLNDAELVAQVSVSVWQCLMEDQSFKSNVDRFARWKNIAFDFEWFSLSDRFSIESKKTFLEAAYYYLQKETDTFGIEHELRKLKLDRLRADFLHLSVWPIEEKLNNDNLFELYEHLDDIDEEYHDDLVIIQENRYEIGFVIYLIVILDLESLHREGRIDHYPKVTSLLKAGLERPYLLWETCRFIKDNRPEIIPYLFADQDLNSLGFMLAKQVSFPKAPEAEAQDYVIHVWKEALKISLQNITYIDTKKQAEFIFHVFRIINKNKYDVHWNSRNELEIQKQRKIGEHRESELFKLISGFQKHSHKVFPEKVEYLLPGTLSDLADFFQNYKERSPLYDSLLKFPLMQIDGLIWLSKSYLSSEFKDDESINKELQSKIAQSFLTLYVNRLEQKTKPFLNSETGKHELRRPIWNEKNERLELVDWIYPVYLVFKSGKLNDFLSPKFVFTEAETTYDENNGFNSDKLRSHFNVLLQILKSFATSVENRVYNKQDIKTIKNSVEQKISEYVTQYSISDPSKGLVDIFDLKYERKFSSSLKDQLLPQLGQAINWFDNKEIILEAFAQSNDVVRILLIAEWITSEGSKKLLIDQIKDEQISEFLNKPYWNTDIQIVLSKIIMYPELIKYIKDILVYYESMPPALKKHNNLDNTIYQTKLFLAFDRKDEKELDAISEADISPNYDGEYYTASDSKEFYRGLIRFKTNPESAYDIFNSLLANHKSKSVYALNRFASGINWALKDNDESVYRKALNEWNAFESIYSKAVDFSEVQDNVWLNKLVVYNNLKEHDEFDKLYLSLETPYRMISLILSTRIENLLERNMVSQAKELLKEAKEYHQSSNEDEIGFLRELAKKVQGDNYIRTLKNNYNEIFSRDVDTLVKIFPTDLNGNDKINAFLTKEVVFAAGKMLDKIQVIKEIRKEDKYTDLLTLALEARIIPWGWYLQPQSRGAFSATQKDLGERDFVMKAKYNDLTVAEAFNFTSKTTVQSHLNKIFNYHHQKHFFILIIYYLGKSDEFEDKWKSYQEDIIPNLIYPKGFELKSKEITEISNTLNNKSAAIRIGESEHGKETTIHHVFINVDYSLPSLNPVVETSLAKRV